MILLASSITHDGGQNRMYLKLVFCWFFILRNYVPRMLNINTQILYQVTNHTIQEFVLKCNNTPQKKSFIEIKQVLFFSGAKTCLTADRWPKLIYHVIWLYI